MGTACTACDRGMLPGPISLPPVYGQNAHLLSCHALLLFNWDVNSALTCVPCLADISLCVTSLVQDQAKLATQLGLSHSALLGHKHNAPLSLEPFPLHLLTRHLS